MREFVRKIALSLSSGQDVELVSVLETSGSTPRTPGALLAALSDGTILGTVGGGNVEFEASIQARELLSQKKNALRKLRFIQGEAGPGMVCGGDVMLHFHFLSAADASVCSVFQDLTRAMDENLNLWLIRKLEGESVISISLACRERLHHFPQMSADFLQSSTVFRDGWLSIPMSKAGYVYIFGGGHVAQALVPVIAAVGFRPVVCDDREVFASPALFPQAEKTVCCSFDTISSTISVTPDDYVVVMTRSHQMDYQVLTQVLRSGTKYIGCIGSQRKLAACRERLLQAGFTAEEYALIHAPIGLSIGAETPAEIAVSIAAEMIAVRAGLNA